MGNNEVILDFVAKLLISGIFLSILVSLSSKSDPSFSYLVLETYLETSIASTLVFHSLITLFITHFFVPLAFLSS